MRYQSEIYTGYLLGCTQFIGQMSRLQGRYILNVQLSHRGIDGPALWSMSFSMAIIGFSVDNQS